MFRSHSSSSESQSGDESTRDFSTSRHGRRRYRNMTPERSAENLPTEQNNVPRISTFNPVGEAPSTPPPTLPENYQQARDDHDHPDLEFQGSAAGSSFSSEASRSPQARSLSLGQSETDTPTQQIAIPQHLRRSPFMADLRGSAASLRLSDLNSWASSSNATTEIRFPLPQPNSREVNPNDDAGFVRPAPQEASEDGSTPGGSVEGIYVVDEERIRRWRLTASVLPQGNIPSPLSPRPFNQQELSSMGMSVYGSSSDDSSSTEGYVPGMSEELFGSEAGPSYMPLSQMHMLQEASRNFKAQEGQSKSQIFQKVNKNNTDELGHATNSSPDKKGENKGRDRSDTVKPKPPPLFIPPTHAADGHGQQPQLGPSPDLQTYTTEGLVRILQSMYMPAAVPSLVTDALPSPEFLINLSNPSTPVGLEAHQRALTSPNAIQVTTKDRNYIAFFIDTLIKDSQKIRKEIEALEEEVDDKEVEKANMQGDITFYYSQSTQYLKKKEVLERLVAYMYAYVTPSMKQSVITVAGDWAIDILEIYQRLGTTTEIPPPGTRGNTAECNEEDEPERIERIHKKNREAPKIYVDEQDREPEQVEEVPPKLVLAEMKVRLKKSEFTAAYWRSRAMAAEQFIALAQAPDRQ